MLKQLTILALAAAAGLGAYIRLAPYEADRWHLPPSRKEVGDYPSPVGFEAVRAFNTAPDEMLKAVDLVAMQTPRTRRASGAPDTGLMTYETRSNVMGFPDYTTVAVIPQAGGDGPPLLSINARLRFGQADMGVNRKRVEDWLAQLGPLIVPAS